MHARFVPRLITLALALGLGACASQPPEWIMNPRVTGGFAATECVRDSGNMSLDRQVAVAKARAEVAKQFELRVAAMDKTYARLTEETTAPAKGDKPGQARSVQTAFESVSKQVAEQTLSGLTPTRVEYVDLQDARQLCVEVAADKSAARAAYDQVVKASGNQVDTATNEALYQEFAGAEAGAN